MTKKKDTFSIYQLVWFPVILIFIGIGIVLVLPSFVFNPFLTLISVIAGIIFVIVGLIMFVKNIAKAINKEIRES